MEDKGTMKCIHCGGAVIKSQTHGGYHELLCQHCGNKKIELTETDVQNIYEIHCFTDRVITIMNEQGTKAKKKRMWQDDADLKKLYNKHCAEAEKYPFFAICCAAYQTNGFLEYYNNKDAVDAWYDIAKNYLKQLRAEHDHHVANELYLSKYVKLYEKLRNKKRNILIRFGSTFSFVLAALIIGFVLYSPVVSDLESGISISIPHKSISAFDKWNISIDAAVESLQSNAYSEAKNALRNETKTFVLYDLSLLGNKSSVELSGSVRVEIPIPEGMDKTALKIYHIVNDEEYEEIPSSVSSKNNTITFYTTHFSHYAVAERHQVVFFDANGANSVENLFVKRDNLAEEPATPQKKGYTFVGWTLNGVLWDFSKDTVTKDMTLVAKWIPNEYIVTLDKNGGSTQIDTFPIRYMSAYESLPKNVFKPGYTFIGWFTSSFGGTQITKDSIMDIADNLTLYAHFEANANKLRFDANGGTGEMPSLTVNTDETISLPICKFERKGYTFVGWSTSRNGVAEYSNLASYTMPTDSETILYAVWSLNEYTVFFETVGGPDMDFIVYTVNDTVTLPEAIRDHYIFEGWYTNAEYDGDPIKSFSDEIGEKIFYAKWTPIEYTITFHPDGGTPVDEIIYTVESETFRLKDSNKTGYTFLGWFDPQGNRVESVVLGTYGNLELTARWRAIVYTITLNNESATESGIKEIFETYNLGFYLDRESIQNIVKIPELPKKTGFVFQGYYASVTDNATANASGTVQYINANGDILIDATAFTENVTFYALWIPAVYTITLDSQGAEEAGSSAYYEKYATGIYLNADCTQAGKITVPVRDGFTFMGYFESVSDNGTASAAGIGQIIAADGTILATDIFYTADKTLIALWAEPRYEITLDSQGADVSGSTGIYQKTHVGLYWDMHCALNVSGNRIAVPEKTGYTFGGYYTSVSGNHSTSPVGQNQYIGADGTILITNSTFTANTTLYALWYLNSFNATWDDPNHSTMTVNRTSSLCSDASIGVLNSGATVYYGDQLQITYIADTGYHFDVNGSAQTQFTVSFAVTEDFTSEDMIRTPQLNTYTIVYHSNIGDGNSISEAGQRYGASKTLSTTPFSRVGWNFSGWNTKADGSGTAYANNASVNNLGWGDVHGETITLYAQWSLVTSHSYYADSVTVKDSSVMQISQSLATHFDIEYLADHGYRFYIIAGFHIREIKDGYQLVGISCAPLESGFWGPQVDQKYRIYGSGKLETSNSTHERNVYIETSALSVNEYLRAYHSLYFYFSADGFGADDWEMSNLNFTVYFQ